MKKLILLLVFLSFPANAEWAKMAILCMPEKQFSEAANGIFGESPLLNGNTDGGSVELWTNPQTGTFGFVFYPGDGTACVVSAGDNLTPGPKQPGQESNALNSGRS